jgi:hypothetical protein
MINDELSPEEYEVLRRARAGVAPPRRLEDDTVAILRERGLVRPPRRIRSIPSARRMMTWAIAATVVAIAGWVIVQRLPRQEISTSAVLTRSAATAPSTIAGPRYMLLLYAGGTPVAGAPDTRRREYADWARGIASRGVAISGEELSEEAREVGAATADGSVSVAPPSGPLPRGYFVVSAPDLASAQRIASTCPHLRYGGRIVVKKIVG